MCGRYALHLRPSEVRQRLADQDMPADDAPADDDPQIRQSYNFAPSYHGLIYRAATNDRGFDATPLDEASTSFTSNTDGEPSPKKAKLTHPTAEVDGMATRETKYKLQSAKWGLIPFWTKRSPDYGSIMRTINCRDDSLSQNGGMWQSMKQRKRCIVVAEGFYEWLKKDNGKQKIPHFVKRKDGGLMCFAGLWDCLRYESDDDVKEAKDGTEAGAGEDVEAKDKLYTYTIITTDSNKQLQFLHDRMPVIFEAGSDEMKRWLDPTNTPWNKDLQSMLHPFRGELECYPVDREVGKVGNNSPNFVIPFDSKENKKNIANFFGNQRAKAASVSPTKAAPSQNNITTIKKESEVNPDETRQTSKVEDPESNAPLPRPASHPDSALSQAINADSTDLPDSALVAAADEGTEQNIKREADELDDEALLEAEKSPPRHIWNSPSKPRSRNIFAEADEVGDEEMLDAEKSPPQHVWASPSKVKAKREEVDERPSSPTEAKAKSKTEVGSSTPRKTRSATANPARTPKKGEGAAEGNKKITAFFGGK